MSKSSRQKSTNPDYEVGYGRPPVATQFAPKTSGNPRGRPPKAKAKGHQKPNAASGLSAIHRAVLDVGAAKVEVRRGGRKVMMTQVEAAVEGLAEAARNGNVRAAQVYIGLHSEAEAEADALRQRVEAADHTEIALRIAASLRAAKRDGPDRAELEPPASDIESVGAEVEDQTRPSDAPEAWGDWSDRQRDAPPHSACLNLAAHDNLPEPPKDAPACSQAPSLPTPAVQVKPIVRSAPATKVIPRRSGDPLIPDRRPIKAGGWGVSG
ncbi:MAG: hypothetical protein B7Y44_07080 [Sphingomonadales bacterium 28-55-16]|nr:MAG: hypothetical protein B7Y44_07080 [Sphingomonadales bacterium 28-55-16]